MVLITKECDMRFFLHLDINFTSSCKLYVGEREINQWLPGRPLYPLTRQRPQSTRIRTSRIRLCSVAKLQIRSELKVRQKRTRSFLIWYAFVALLKAQACAIWRLHIETGTQTS